ncbi:hypothetical protein [Deinococcus humi]|uniref:DUF4333 domain-containing protein n=1 Tax=Deinococcus humi TaxID=662880 RepID=A0A7W8NH31_9DEIO|nr:hypothetical protein [Deinococcus humi]MBB5365445.1 hypothetical protein [Deinococcus humi]GGO37270.1 hypothetical protein GCM10008949_42300 [Deinococcus humi]
MSKRARPKKQPAAPTVARPELREVTPAQRSRSLRTFFWILLAFVVGIGVIVATLAVQGRAARDYGTQVLQAVRATNPAENASYSLKCITALPQPLPRGILDCDVTVDRGKVSVVLQAEGDRQYRLGQ